MNYSVISFLGIISGKIYHPTKYLSRQDYVVVLQVINTACSRWKTLHFPQNQFLTIKPFQIMVNCQYGWKNKGKIICQTKSVSTVQQVLFHLARIALYPFVQQGYDFTGIVQKMTQCFPSISMMGFNVFGS